MAVAEVGAVMAVLVIPPGVPAAVASGGASPYTTLTVGIGSEPAGVAVDETSDTIYAANSGSGTVSVIDGATNSVAATINAGPDPKGVGVEDATDTIYATNSEFSGWVSVIDGAANTVTAIGRHPAGVAVDETTDTIYGANDHSDTVSVIIPATVNVTPPSGPDGTAVTVSGQGFNPGETVKIIYKTGLVSPTSVTICSATAASDTSYTCSGSIPTATVGANGAHNIVAKGLTSGIKVKAIFTLI